MPAVKTRGDDEHSKLANLLANREDGVDTFGNWGNLRYVSVSVSIFDFASIFGCTLVSYSSFHSLSGFCD